MTWSHPRVASFDDCPYKWFLSYSYRDENGRSLKKKSSFFAEFGSYMHRILRMHLSGLLERECLSAYYVVHFKENVLSEAPNSKVYMNHFQQGFHYLDDFSFPSRTIIGVEEKVNFMFAGREFTGFVGLTGENGELIVTDHKSKTLKPRSKRSKPARHDTELDEYLRQLYAYSATVKGKYDRYPDILEFNCFHSQAMIQEPFELERLYTVENWASKTIDSIAANDKWGAKPDYWRCNYLCDVRDYCEYKGLI